MPIEQSLLPWLPKSLITDDSYDVYVGSQLCMLHPLEPTLFAAFRRSTHWSQSLALERPVTFMLQRSMICNFAMAIVTSSCTAEVNATGASAQLAALEVSGRRLGAWSPTPSF